MRYIIIAATAFALNAGIALGFVVRDTVFEAEAAKPPPTGRLIELGTLTVASEETAEFPLVNVSDCSALSAFVTTPPRGSGSGSRSARTRRKTGT